MNFQYPYRKLVISGVRDVSGQPALELAEYRVYEPPGYIIMPHTQEHLLDVMIVDAKVAENVKKLLAEVQAEEGDPRAGRS